MSVEYSEKLKENLSDILEKPVWIGDQGRLHSTAIFRLIEAVNYLLDKEIEKGNGSKKTNRP